MIKVAINGFGRIGRMFLKLAVLRPELDIVAVNDLGDINNLAYLLKYDTAYGKSNLDISVKDGNLVVNGKQIAFISEKDRKSTRLNSSHGYISYAVFCLK